MTQSIITNIIFVVVAVVIIKKLELSFFSRKSGTKNEKLPYYKKKYLLSQAEVSFFRALEEAIENKYYIFSQVHLSDLLYIKTDRKELLKYRNKIDRKSVDFVITDKNYLSPLLAIELDDSSHYRKNRIDRDDFVEDAFEGAGLPLLRVKNSSSYNVQKLRVSIEELISDKKENDA